MYCILIAGMPASGKTTLARTLSERLKIPMVSKDEIKELFYDTVGFTSREMKVQLGNGSMDAMYYFAEANFRLGLPIIMENNFENASKPGLLSLLEKYKVEPITVLLDGDVSVIYERFIKRDQSKERHRGHVVNTCYPEPEGVHIEAKPMELATFEQKFSQRGMRNFSIGGHVIHVDCTDIEKIEIDQIINAINSIRNTSENA